MAKPTSRNLSVPIRISPWQMLQSVFLPSRSIFFPLSTIPWSRANPWYSVSTLNHTGGLERILELCRRTLLSNLRNSWVYLRSYKLWFGKLRQTNLKSSLQRCKVVTGNLPFPTQSLPQRQLPLFHACFDSRSQASRSVRTMYNKPRYPASQSLPSMFLNPIVDIVWYLGRWSERDLDSWARQPGLSGVEDWGHRYLFTTLAIPWEQWIKKNWCWPHAIYYPHHGVPCAH